MTELKWDAKGRQSISQLGVEQKKAFKVKVSSERVWINISAVDKYSYHARLLAARLSTRTRVKFHSRFLLTKFLCELFL